MAMKTGMVALGALAVVIAGGAMTTEPRGMQSDELEFEGDTYIPCPGEHIHDLGSLSGPMLLLQYDYKLTVHPNGELVVYRKTPPIGDWTRCIGPSH
jgi:hypothetical protein